MSKATIRTETHYTDAHGQHYLPLALQRREMSVGTVVIEGYDSMPDQECDEMQHVLTCIGIVAGVGCRGDLVVEKILD